MLKGVKFRLVEYSLVKVRLVEYIPESPGTGDGDVDKVGEGQVDQQPVTAGPELTAPVVQG